jgi:hypothetical protein
MTTTTEMIATEKAEAERLPLWKAVLSDMRATAEHGTTWPEGWFVDRLKCRPETMEFRLAVSMIRQGLEHCGMELSQKAGQYVILMPADNAGVMRKFNSRAVKSLRRAVILGGSTPTAGLTDSEKREHEKQLSKSAFRLALMRRRTSEISDEKKEISE